MGTFMVFIIYMLRRKYCNNKIKEVVPGHDMKVFGGVKKYRSTHQQME
jgi:hypothetical protein